MTRTTHYGCEVVDQDTDATTLLIAPFLHYSPRTREL